MEQMEILVRSTLDDTLQPSLFYQSATKEKRPLLVGLHTWSFDRFNQIENMLPFAQEQDFHLLLPEFRGKNTAKNPNCTKACGSAFAKQDIKDAIDFVLREYDNVDEKNIFLLGASGGGHMALLMAGYCPEYFKVIGSFVPITDLKKWAEQSEHYGKQVKACCGESEEEMWKRSPAAYLDTIAKANLKIFHGKYDTTVPVTHSLELYRQLIEKYPTCRVFLDIFDGGHEMPMNAATAWILSQYRKTEQKTVTG